MQDLSEKQSHNVPMSEEKYNVQAYICYEGVHILNYQNRWPYVFVASVLSAIARFVSVQYSHVSSKWPLELVIILSTHDRNIHRYVGSLPCTKTIRVDTARARSLYPPECE